VAALSALLTIVMPIQAHAQTLTPAMAPLEFLVGAWSGGEAHTADGSKLLGGFQFEAAAGGAALLRRDHSQTLDRGGRVVLTEDRVMLIYPEGDRLHADYVDGGHVIHYASATIEPGRSVRFVSTPGNGGPTFGLTYRKSGADSVSIRFEMAPPGQSAFQLIAEGVAERR
jgi:hypothetical protein